MRPMRALLALLLALATPGLAQRPDAAALREAERAAEAARAAGSEAARRAAEAGEAERRLAERRVALAAEAQARDAAHDAALARAAAAQDAARAAGAEATQRREALAPLLPLMLRLSLWPEETLLALPVPPEEALRGAAVLRAAAARIGAETAGLNEAARRAEAAAAGARREAAEAAAAEAAARSSAAALDAELAAARARRGAAERAEIEAAQRASAALREAADLRDLLARMERERAAAERRRPAPAPERDRPTPVAGRVATDWGEGTPAGPARGLTYATPPGARVVAPCSGRAAFAAPFRSYGLLLILDCGAGLHLVLAGFERLDTAAGERVQLGEPLGAMGAARPRLYLELRRNGQPVDPRPWLAGR
jgi:murein DD-endopeptidase MepM/ murein hydrolase activator NlpD